MKTCSKCGEKLPLDNFWKDARKKSGLKSWCKKCAGASYTDWRLDSMPHMRAYQKERYALDPAPRKAQRKKRYVENKEVQKQNAKAYYRANPGRRYGLTADEFVALKTRNGGLCEICGGPASDVDHCHSSLAVRGFLCRHCNTALGLFKDDPAILTAAREYLLRFAEQAA